MAIKTFHLKAYLIKHSEAYYAFFDKTDTKGDITIIKDDNAATGYHSTPNYLMQ
jgi:hypothetical protein